ncbi:2,3-bisphosphoglycerate-independent phosphoglycerate mutase [Acrasis kona]|uniref:2,3-bisphosphoglycerate-independent phosphoglycerate mutase n=1 Tax=Acrasis kona TaxID=1008807 RepID=A0AAW2ZAG2_9EUKA
MGEGMEDTSKTNTKKRKFSVVAPQVITAWYGPRDVTKIVDSFVQRGDISFRIGNSIFSDPWFGVVKTFIMAYSIDDKTYAKAGKEGEIIHLDHDEDSIIQTEGIRYKHDIQVYLAQYGFINVTKQVVESIVENRTLHLTIEKGAFGSNSSGYESFLLMFKVAGDNSIRCSSTFGKGVIHIIPCNSLTIKSAKYGPMDVTNNVRAYVRNDPNDQLRITADNQTFSASPFLGVQKIFRIEYSADDKNVKVITVPEGSCLVIKPVPPAITLNFFAEQLHQRTIDSACYDLVIKTAI